jgi:PKD repeat protein
VVSPLAPHGANQPPTATANVTCNHAVCSVDATQSADPEGSALTYRWSFGDGTNSTSAVASHTFASAGTYQISLQVTDNKGTVGSATKTVTVGAAAPVTFAGASNTIGGATKLNVTVPNVAPGTALLLFTAKNSKNVTLDAPSGVTGWQPLGTATNGPVTSQVWGKFADAGDAGQTVTVVQSGHTKVDVQLVAYSGVSLTDPLGAIVSNSDSRTANHTTPSVDVNGAGSVVVSYWLDKSSTTTAWTVPSSVVARDSVFGSGSGYLTSVIADSGSAVPAGTYSGVTASVAQPSAKGIAWSIVLNPTP